MSMIFARQKTMADRVFNLVNYSLLILFMIITIYPFFNSVVLAFNDGKDALKGGIYFYPRVFTLVNFKEVLSQSEFIGAAFMTVARTLAGTASSLLFTSAFGYVISKKYLCFRKFYMVFSLITIYFSGGLIPTFILIRSLGLINNFLVYVLPGLLNMFNALIFMSFFRTLPEALEESARLDGASDPVIFARIILPISTPVLASIALFTAVGHWNAWFDTMLYANKLETLSHMFMKMVTMQQFLEDPSNTSAMLAGEQAKLSSITSTSLNLAAMVVTSAPIILVYPFLQKYFVKGIMLGSIKG